MPKDKQTLKDKLEQLAWLNQNLRILESLLQDEYTIHSANNTKSGLYFFRCSSNVSDKTEILRSKYTHRVTRLLEGYKAEMEELAKEIMSEN